MRDQRTWGGHRFRARHGLAVFFFSSRFGPRREKPIKDRARRIERRKGRRQRMAKTLGCIVHCQYVVYLCMYVGTLGASLFLASDIQSLKACASSLHAPGRLRGLPPYRTIVPGFHASRQTSRHCSRLPGTVLSYLIAQRGVKKG